MATPTGVDPAHVGHAHDVGPAGSTYDLRFIDGMRMMGDGPTKENRVVILAQRAEIIELRRMLAVDGLRKPAYHKYDALFAL
ncbi:MULTISPECIES: hypothetical protein [Synechococcaceae]|uniref:hypothetical protein n=1 Tax=Synechococcaceae TaxID=1890426 RepID=UPI0008FF4DA2|nr:MULTISPECIES: hypothetical protein [Synechococcaceae]APD47105.1 hypothetical protein BM449_00665 [Synechococcus sp. SynAce01]